MAKKTEYRRCECCGQRFMDYFGSRNNSNDEYLCKDCSDVVGEGHDRAYRRKEGARWED